MLTKQWDYAMKKHDSKLRPLFILNHSTWAEQGEMFAVLCGFNELQEKVERRCLRFWNSASNLIECPQSRCLKD